MRIEVRYFAGLREAVGCEREALDLPVDVRSVGALRAWLVARGDPWSAALTGSRRVRAAVNLDMARDDTGLSDGAEVAFFPPVTGG